jgi:hypothetical protein
MDPAQPKEIAMQTAEETAADPRPLIRIVRIEDPGIFYAYLNSEPDFNATGETRQRAVDTLMEVLYSEGRSGNRNHYEIR